MNQLTPNPTSATTNHALLVLCFLLIFVGTGCKSFTQGPYKSMQQDAVSNRQVENYLREQEVGGVHAFSLDSVALQRLQARLAVGTPELLLFDLNGQALRWQNPALAPTKRLKKLMRGGAAAVTAGTDSSLANFAYWEKAMHQLSGKPGNVPGQGEDTDQYLLVLFSIQSTKAANETVLVLHKLLSENPMERTRIFWVNTDKQLWWTGNRLQREP